MHHAGLDGRVGPGRLDRFGEAGEAVAADDQDVFDATVGKLRADTRPELRALGLLHPDPQDVLDAVHVDADGEVSGLVADVGAVADLDHKRVEIDHRIERFQRSALPSQHLLADRVDDLRDRLLGKLGADRGPQMMRDPAQRHPAGIEADDHVVQAAEATSETRHHLRAERAVAVPRDV